MQIPKLKELAAKKGMECIIYPIRDGYTPTDEASYLQLVDNILAKMREGKNVLVHCRWGLGRTGVFVASCLIALGVRPKDSIVKVREVRLMAIQTEIQEQYVSVFDEVWKRHLEASGAKKSASSEEKKKSCYYNRVTILFWYLR